MNTIIKFIDAFSEWTGRIISWLVMVMVLVIVFDVAMRYLLQSGSVALQELEWHLFALVFMLGAGYTLKHDAHVRVDIFYQSHWMNDVRRAWVNLFGALFLLLPFCILIIVSAWPFVMNSYNVAEGSPDPGGLPFRFLLKAVIPVAFFLLSLQGLALLLTSLRVIIGKTSNQQKASLNSSKALHAETSQSHNSQIKKMPKDK